MTSTVRVVRHVATEPMSYSLEKQQTVNTTKKMNIENCLLKQQKIYLQNWIFLFFWKEESCYSYYSGRKRKEKNDYVEGEVSFFFEDKKNRYTFGEVIPLARWSFRTKEKSVVHFANKL